MSKKKIALILCLVLTLTVLSPACKKKRTSETVPSSDAQEQVPTPEPSDRDATEPDTQIKAFVATPPEVQQIDQSAAAINERGELKTIYFGYDKDDLTDAARATLRQNANWLKASPQWNVVLEGHCDERGTIEYNLALGQRRANSVRSYMASLGVDVSRMRTVSYGEERPVDNGHSEAAWAKNRRAVSKVEDR